MIHPPPITTTGIFVAAYTAFLPACDGPDETLLRGQIMSSLADQVRAPIQSVDRMYIYDSMLCSVTLLTDRRID